MSSKRQATSNLNHDNWDQEEEPEDRGTFKTASADELKARVIKKATRRKANAGGSDAEDSAGPSGGVFSGFSGFGRPSTVVSSSSGSPFSFLSNLPAASATITEPFGKTPSSTSTPPAKQFSFQTAISELPSSSSNTSIAASQTAPIATTSTFVNSTVFQHTNSPKASVPMFKPAVPVDNPFTNNCTPEYCDNVAELNKQLMKWIQENMDKNPKCILLPVFASYEEHLKELLDKAKPQTLTSTNSIFSITTPTTTSSSFYFGKPADSTSQVPMFGKRPNCTVTSGGTTTAVTAPIFSFGNMQKSPTKSEAATSSSPPASIFSFSAKPSTSTASTDSIKPSFFSFGTTTAAAADSVASTATSPPKTNGISFDLKKFDKPSTSGFSGFSKPSTESTTAAASSFSFAAEAAKFSFGNAKPTSTTSTTTSSNDNEANGAEDEEDRPPKVEFKQVVEEDASFSKRCKVFVKKDNDFTDRGVGTLYLKPIKDSEKTQMLVRADTNLGNILINLILSEGLPCQRMGKNNVMMVCIPTPEESKPMSILLRVKTAEEADELLEKIKKHTV